MELFWLNPFYEKESEPILRDAFKWDSQGIFVALDSAAETQQVELPWGDEDPETLDVAYFANHSGSKFCAPIVKLFLQTEDFVDEDGQLNQIATEKLAKILLRKYLINWQRLWLVNQVTYDPIHNYNMYEERDLATTEDQEKVVDGSLARTGTDTLAHGMVETVDHGRTTDTMTYRYGINTDTSDPKPSDKETVEEGGDTVTTDSGSDVQTKNLLDETDETETIDNDGTEHEEIHRYGNIGVTTSQKMVADERELWLWNYFDQIFADIDRELALAIHDPCRV